MEPRKKVEDGFGVHKKKYSKPELYIGRTGNIKSLMGDGYYKCNDWQCSD